MAQFTQMSLADVQKSLADLRKMPKRAIETLFKGIRKSSLTSFAALQLLKVCGDLAPVVVFSAVRRNLQLPLLLLLRAAKATATRTNRRWTMIFRHSTTFALPACEDGCLESQGAACACNGALRSLHCSECGEPS